MKWIYRLTLAFVFSSSAYAAEFDATIPVVDLNDYHHPEKKEQFLKTLSNALQEVGFFAVINTGVDQEILNEAYQHMEAFFQLPLEEKMKHHQPENNGQRGYVQTESARGEAVVDFKEFYHVGRELTDKEITVLGFWKNIWPESIELQGPTMRLFDAIEEHKHELERAICEILQVDESLLSEMTNQGDVLLRAIHYPKNPPKDQIWAAAHTDIDLMTILPRATAEGLQVLNRNGEWITVVVPEDAFIVNCGDMLENLTNGFFRSGAHRVVALGENVERYSIVQFIHPKASDRLDPLPHCIQWTGGIKRYADATRLELLEERLVDLGLASKAMMIHLAESGLMDRLIEVGRASVQAMEILRREGLASEAVLAELERLEGLK